MIRPRSPCGGEVSSLSRRPGRSAGDPARPDLAEPRGSEPGYRHPVLVLQRDEVNASRINTVVVCRLTSNTALARAPGNTLLPRRRTGLRRDSVANASQVATLNKADLEELVGAVPRDLMDEVVEGLRWFLNLG